jgi:hypothetical protein
MEKVHVTLRIPKVFNDKLIADAEKDRRDRSYIINEIIEKHYSNGHQEPRTATKKKAGAR